MRVLVTGSRDWWPPHAVRQWLDYYSHRALHHMVVVHGGAKGADAMASAWVRQNRSLAFPVIEETHPAIWRPYGIYNPQAGLVRNRKMVELGADICLAFIKDGSRGASHCARLAEEAGITTRRFTE